MPVKRASKGRGEPSLKREREESATSASRSKQPLAAITLSSDGDGGQRAPLAPATIPEDAITASLEGLEEGTRDGSHQLVVLVCDSELQVLLKNGLEACGGVEIETTRTAQADQRVTLSSDNSMRLAVAAARIAYALARAQRSLEVIAAETYAGFSLCLVVPTNPLAAAIGDLEAAASKEGVRLRYSTLACGYGFSPFTKLTISGPLLGLVAFVKVLSLLQVLVGENDPHRLCDSPVRSDPTALIVQTSLIGTYGYPTTFKPQEVNEGVLEANIQALLAFSIPRHELDDASPADLLARTITEILDNDLSSSDPAVKQQFMKFTIDVHVDIVGMIIGKNGVNINEVRKLSNCQLKVMDAVVNHYANDRATYEKNQHKAASHRQIQVSGKYQNVRVALYKLLELVSDM